MCRLVVRGCRRRPRELHSPTRASFISQVDARGVVIAIVSDGASDLRRDCSEVIRITVYECMQALQRYNAQRMAVVKKPGDNNDGHATVMSMMMMITMAMLLSCQ